MNVVTLARLADTPTQVLHVPMTVTTSMHVADVVKEYIVTAASGASYLLTEAGDRLLTEAGDLLTTES